MRRLSLLACPLLLLAACGGDPSIPVADECNPLGINHCMTPWPSSAFERDDATSATGQRLAIPMGALPTNAEGITIDPAEWNVADGFSAAAPMVMSFPGGVSKDNLPPVTDPGQSLEDASPTLIIDLDTGERVAHFAELDAPAVDTPDHQALYLRPTQRLTGGHRYAVVLKKTLKSRDGSDLPVSAGFQSLLDGGVTSHPLLEKQRAGFADVLAAIEADGTSRDDLLLAWDFTVASDEFVWSDMKAARQQALDAMDETPPDFEVFGDEVVDDGTVIAHKIVGEFDAPLFLDHNGNYTAVAITKVVRGDDGLPALQGTYRAPFTAIIPTCAYTAPEPVGIIIYGHGLMGESNQVASGSQRDAAATTCLVVIGTDMRGMSSPDIGAVASALTNLNNAGGVFEVLEQGIINHLALVRVATGAMASRLFVDDPEAAEPRSLVDPTKVYYYGLSQGGIFGTSVVAWDPVIRRGVVGAGGANYSMMLERSTDWPQYRDILIGAYPDNLDLVLLINLLQNRWDKTEGSGVAHVVLEGTPLGSPSKQLIQQIGLGDDEVPNIAAHWQARTEGIPVLAPTVDEPWGLEVVDSPVVGGSALVIMDGGAPAAPLENIPAPETGAHYVTREQPATWRQMGTFYETGEIVNECTGACDCAAGQCD